MERTGEIAMTSRIKKSRGFMLGWFAVLLSGILLFASSEYAQANRGDRPNGGFREFRDMRYRHDRVYPVRGQHIRALPHDHRVVVYSGARYYFHGGIWYRPAGANFVIVAPPIGLYVPLLPPFYSTIWIGRVPYYYANEVYYARQGEGYVVVEPPKEEVSQVAPADPEMFVYPRQGQSEKQQADDRYACHRWAVSQTGFDPTQPAGGATDAKKGRDRADYQRAMGACLDGRGYTVK
jgi:hypothetical protein